MAEVIVVLYIMTMIFMLISIISGGLLIYFRQAVFNALKLHQFIFKYGFVICRLKRIDKTEKEIITIPDKETNGVRFPGVEGLYTLDNASVILKDRKYPVYEWREGETAPINYEKETISTPAKCPNCEKEINFNIKMPKSISPSVLDNLIIKIKTLTQMMTMDKLLLYLIIGGIAIVAVVGINIFLTYDFSQRIGELVAPYCRQAVSNTTIIL